MGRRHYAVDNQKLPSVTTIISQTQSKLKTIGVAAFADCKTLASITIPNRVEIIRHNAFINCKELETINKFSIRNKYK